jgi:hypothetical protein
LRTGHDCALLGFECQVRYCAVVPPVVVRKTTKVDDRHMDERRRPDPDTALGYLERLPALVLLERLPVPVLAVQHDGCRRVLEPGVRADARLSTERGR